MNMKRMMTALMLSSVMMSAVAMPTDKTMMCATMCHSSDNKPDFPSLAHQDQSHLLKSMEAFQREKARG
jgi:cytochrome c553